jgi:cytochrome c oxidase subunit 3
VSETALHQPWSDVPQERQATTIGMWIFLSSEILLFGGMVMLYAAYRYLEPAGFLTAAKATDVRLGTINTMALLTSSFAMAIAADAADAGLRRLSIAGLLGTIVFGAAFLVIKGFEYSDDIRQHLLPNAQFPIAAPGARLFFSIYWVATGVHTIHLSIGMALVGRLAIVSARSATPLQRFQIDATALYWHLVDVIWIFLYPLLYLAGRS